MKTIHKLFLVALLGIASLTCTAQLNANVRLITFNSLASYQAGDTLSAVRSYASMWYDATSDKLRFMDNDGNKFTLSPPDSGGGSVGSQFIINVSDGAGGFEASKLSLNDESLSGDVLDFDSNSGNVTIDATGGNVLIEGIEYSGTGLFSSSGLNITSLSSLNLNGSTVNIEGIRYPSSDGSSGQVLQTNGSGVLSFVTPASGSGGSSSETFTGVANVSSISSPEDFFYSSSGDGVAFAFTVNVTPTASATTTTFRVSIPIASNFTSAANDLSGIVTFLAASGASVGSVVQADTVNDEIEVTFVSTGTGGHTVRVSGVYEVL